MNAVLRSYAQAYASLSGFNDDYNTRIYTMFNSVLNQSHVIVISGTEPTGVLPLNVIWLVEDKLSNYYQQFLVRTSKTAADGYANTWKLITEVLEIYTPQYFDAGDNALYAGKVLDASTTVAGVAKISYASSTPNTPVFVAVGDSRNTNSRDPKAHAHAEKALREIKTLTGAVNVVSTNSTADSTTIIADSPTSATQRKLGKNEVL